MSQDALLLCVHIFLSVSLSLSISSCLFFSISPLPFNFPTGDLLFLSCGIWDPIHWEHIVLLLSTPADGPREAEWVLLVSAFSVSLPPPSASRHPTPCSLPCDDVMAFICFGVPIDSLSLLHTPYISPLSPHQPPSYTPVFLFSLSECLSQILSPLKRHQGDLGMFGCCSAHPRHMLYTQIGKLSAP